MDPSTLLTWTSGIHTAIFPFSLVGLYRYVDRSTLFTKSVGDADDLLTRMRSHVAGALEERLSLVFERAGSEPGIVNLDSYSERPVSPVGSESYRQAFREFIDADVGVLVDYRRTLRARARWCFWTRILSWTVLALAAWQALCAASFGLLVQLFDMTVPSSIAKWSFAPTVMFSASFFVCQAFMLRYHDTIQESKAQYHDL